MMRSVSFFFVIMVLLHLSLIVGGCTKTELTGTKMPDGVSAVPAELVSLPENMLANSPSSADESPVIDAYINKWGTGGAFVVKTKQGSRLVHGATIRPNYPVIDFITISPDGKRIAYVIPENGKVRLVLDSKQGELFDVVNSPVFTLDSRHIVYKARRGEKWHLVIDGKVGGERYLIDGDPLMTPDGSGMIVLEKKTEKSPFAITLFDMSFRSKTLKEVNAINVHFTGDLQRVAAVIQEGGKKKVVYSNLYTDDVLHEGKLWDDISQLNFDPTGKHIAYGAKEGGKRFIVFDNRVEPLPEGEFIERPVINTAGMTVATIMLSHKVYLHQAFSKGKRQKKMYEEINDIQFSADGSRTIFIGANDKKYFLSVNGNEGPRFDKAVSARLSPDGRFIVYRARQDGKRFMVIADADGKTIRTLPAYEMVFEPRFTKDEKYVAYGVKDGNKLIWMVEKLSLP